MAVDWVWTSMLITGDEFPAQGGTITKKFGMHPGWAVQRLIGSGGVVNYAYEVFNAASNGVPVGFASNVQVYAPEPGANSGLALVKNDYMSNSIAYDTNNIGTTAVAFTWGSGPGAFDFDMRMRKKITVDGDGPTVLYTVYPFSPIQTGFMAPTELWGGQLMLRMLYTKPA